MTTRTVEDSRPESQEESLLITDYVEAVVLILACLSGLVGNLAVLKVSFKIRSFSRQISLLFCAVICADAIICATRIPVTVYLILSHPPRYLAREEGEMSDQDFEAVTSLTTSLNMKDTTSSTWDKEEFLNNDTTGGPLGFPELGDGFQEYAYGEDAEQPEEKSHVVDMACEVWSASGALLMTIVWLHLVAATQRFYIVFSFSKFRKIFTQTLTVILACAAWLLAVLFIFTPIRGFGLLMERAGRGVCRPSPATPEGVLWARGMTSTVLSGFPLLATTCFYGFVTHSVWLARQVRREASEEYNRVIVVTFARVLSLCLTYFPAIILSILDIWPALGVPDLAHRYLGYLLFAQSVISPFITLQDNDFREKSQAPTKNGVANGSGRGTSRGGGGKRTGTRAGEGEDGWEDGGVVLPDLGSTDGRGGGEADVEGGMNGHPQLQRTISCITSADLRTLRGSND